LNLIYDKPVSNWFYKPVLTDETSKAGLKSVSLKQYFNQFAKTVLKTGLRTGFKAFFNENWFETSSLNWFQTGLG
jgi:hypothetical protein